MPRLSMGKIRRLKTIGRAAVLRHIHGLTNSQIIKKLNLSVAETTLGYWLTESGAQSSSIQDEVSVLTYFAMGASALEICELYEGLVSRDMIYGIRYRWRNIVKFEPVEPRLDAKWTTNVLAKASEVMTLKEMAHYLCVSSPTVCQWRKGRAPFRKYEILFKGLEERVNKLEASRRSQRR